MVNLVRDRYSKSVRVASSPATGDSKAQSDIGALGGRIRSGRGRLAGDKEPFSPQSGWAATMESGEIAGAMGGPSVMGW
jgi:hypothetical protein